MGIPLTAFSERTQKTIGHLANNGIIDERVLYEFADKHISSEKMRQEIENAKNEYQNLLTVFSGEIQNENILMNLKQK